MIFAIFSRFSSIFLVFTIFLEFPYFYESKLMQKHSQKIFLKNIIKYFIIFNYFQHVVLENEHQNHKNHFKFNFSELN